MNVCVIGAGWYGCHAAIVLREQGFNVQILDAVGFFSGSSSKNQNRLHLGYHYPRSKETISECIRGYKQFHERYRDCLEPLHTNLYLIHEDSKTTFQQYQNIFSDHTFYDVSELGFQHVYPIAMNVPEMYINNKKAKQMFQDKLGDILQRAPGVIDFNKYDYVINCTNNTWVPLPLLNKPIYETFCSLLYKIEFKTPSAITVMDGPFFSIFPYDLEQKLYTVTHVIHGVISRGENSELVTPHNIEQVRNTIEMDICKVFPSFHTIATYSDYFLSSKTKYDFVNDDRSLRWNQLGNYFTFSGGKITGIFEMEKILLEKIVCLKDMGASSREISSRDTHATV